MKYRVEIYDFQYKIAAKSEESAVRAALARYAQTASANRCWPGSRAIAPIATIGIGT